MSSNFTHFAKSSAIFFAGTVLSKIIVFLLLPLYTNFLSTEEYGYYDLMTTVLALVVSLSYGQVWVSTMQQIRLRHDGSEAVSSGVAVFAISTICFCIVLFAINYFYPLRYLGLLLLFGFSDALQKMTGYIARAFEKNAVFAVSGIIQSTITVGLNIVLLVVFSLDVAALFISYIVGSLIQSFFLCCFVVRDVKCIRPSRKVSIQIAKTAVPLGLNDLSAWLLNSYSRVVVSEVLSLAANGIYAVGFRFASIMSLGTQCFQYAWQDLSFTTDESRNTPSFFSNAVLQYGKFLLHAGALFLPIIYFIFPFFVGEEFHETFYLIPAFMFYAVISAYSTFMGNIFIVLNKSGQLLVSTALSCIFTVVACVFATKLFGLIGSIAVVCVSFIICIVIRAFLLWRHIGYQVHVIKLLVPIIVFILSSVIFLFSGYLGNSCALLVTIVIFIVTYRARIKELFDSLKAKRQGMSR